MEQNKKNGDYVGVDEKFIPKDEKYVDDSLLGDKQETKKVFKCIGIGCLCFTVVLLVLIIGGFFFSFSIFNKVFNIFTDTRDKVLNTMTEESTSSDEKFENHLEGMKSVFEEQSKEYDEEFKNHVDSMSKEYEDDAQSMQNQFQSFMNSQLDRMPFDM